MLVLGTAAFVVFGAALGFLIGHCLYKNKQHEDSMLAFKQYIKSKKAEVKGSQNVSKQLISSLQIAMLKKLKAIKGAEAILEEAQSKDINQIKKAEEDLMNLDKTYHERMGRKYICTTVFMIVIGVIGYFATLGIYTLLHSKYNRKSLEELTDNKFGKVPLLNALTEEVMIVAFEWDT